MHLAAIVGACLAVGGAPSTPTTETVRQPTRLDWAFAAQDFGKDMQLPKDYDSSKQRYQFVRPKSHDPKRPAPLVLFISPSDQPSGWSAWQQACVGDGALFASPFGAGNNVAPARRVRIILDVLDDVRRFHAVDPDQTYLTGFSGGGRMACAIAFALPECCGGVAPICGTNPPPTLTYLRHRLEDRLAVALITGATDFNRKENEIYMAPWLADLGVHSKLWVVPKLGHAVPGSATVAEVYTWLKADLPRRRAEAQARPRLALGPKEAPSAAEQARHLLETAEQELRAAQGVWRGVALLQGAAQRFAATEPGREAALRLKQIVRDDNLLARIGEQGAADEQRSLAAQARALERFGQKNKALEAWDFLARTYADTPFGAKALAEVQRLRSKEQ